MYMVYKHFVTKIQENLTNELTVLNTEAANELINQNSTQIQLLDSVNIFNYDN